VFQGTKSEFRPIFYFYMKEPDAYTHKWTMPTQTFEKKKSKHESFCESSFKVFCVCKSLQEVMKAWKFLKTQEVMKNV